MTKSQYFQNSSIPDNPRNRHTYKLDLLHSEMFRNSWQRFATSLWFNILLRSLQELWSYQPCHSLETAFCLFCFLSALELIKGQSSTKSTERERAGSGASRPSRGSSRGSSLGSSRGSSWGSSRASQSSCWCVSLSLSGAALLLGCLLLQHGIKHPSWHRWRVESLKSV